MAESLLVSGLGAGNLLTISPLALFGGAGSAQSVRPASIVAPLYGLGSLGSAEPLNIEFGVAYFTRLGAVPLPFAGADLIGPPTSVDHLTVVGAYSLVNTTRELRHASVATLGFGDFFVGPLSPTLVLTDLRVALTSPLPIPFAGAPVFQMEGALSFSEAAGTIYEVPTLLQRVTVLGLSTEGTASFFVGVETLLSFTAIRYVNQPLLPLPLTGAPMHTLEVATAAATSYGAGEFKRGAEAIAFTGAIAGRFGETSVSTYEFTEPYAAHLVFSVDLTILPATSVPINVNRPPQIRFIGRTYLNVPLPNIGYRDRVVYMAGADPAGSGYPLLDGSSRRVQVNPRPSTLQVGSHVIGEARRTIPFVGALLTTYGALSFTQPVRSLAFVGNNSAQIGDLRVTRGIRSISFAGSSTLVFGGIHFVYDLYIAAESASWLTYGAHRIANGTFVQMSGYEGLTVGMVYIHTIQRVSVRNFDGVIIPRPTVVNLRRSVGMYGIYAFAVDAYHAIINANRAVRLNPFLSVRYGVHAVSNLATAFVVNGVQSASYGVPRLSHKHRSLTLTLGDQAFLSAYHYAYNSARTVQITGVEHAVVGVPVRLANLNRTIRVYSTGQPPELTSTHWLAYRQRFLNAYGFSRGLQGYANIRYNPYPVRMPSIGDTSAKGAHAFIPVNRVIRPTPANAHSPRWVGAFHIYTRNRAFLVTGYYSFGVVAHHRVFNSRQFLTGYGAATSVVGNAVIAFTTRRVQMATIASASYGYHTLSGGVVSPTRFFVDFTGGLHLFVAGQAAFVNGVIRFDGIFTEAVGVSALSNPRITFGGDSRFLEMGDHTFLGTMQTVRVTRSVEPDAPALFRTSPYTIYAPSADSATQQARANLPPMETHPAGLPAPFIPGTGAGGYLPESHAVMYRNRRVAMSGSESLRSGTHRLQMANRRLLFKGRNFLAAGWWIVSTPTTRTVAFTAENEEDRAAYGDFTAQRVDTVRYIAFDGIDTQFGALLAQLKNRAYAVFGVYGFVAGYAQVGTRRWFDAPSGVNHSAYGEFEAQYKNRAVGMRGAEPPPQRSPRSVTRIYETRVPIRFVGVVGAIGSMSASHALQHVSAIGVVGWVGQHHIALYAQNTVFYGYDWSAVGDFRRYQPVRMPPSTHEDAIGAAVISLVTPGCGCDC